MHCISEKYQNHAFIETEIYGRLVFQYAQKYYQYKKKHQSIIEMKKCIDAMKLAGSEHGCGKDLWSTFEKLIEENSCKASIYGKLLNKIIILVKLFCLKICESNFISRFGNHMVKRYV